MNEVWRLPPQSFVQKNMLGAAVDPFLASNDVGDVHQAIIDHVCEMIGRASIRFSKDLMIHLRPRYSNLVAKLVMKNAFSLSGDIESYYIGSSIGTTLLDSSGSKERQ